MNRSALEIAAKIDALGLWDRLTGFNFAVKPHANAYHYFFSAKNDGPGTGGRRMMLFEGWKTFHDYVRMTADSGYGIFTSPLELPHFEAVASGPGGFVLLRFDTGYVPRGPDAAESDLCARLLWQVYGIAMRMETDANLPLKYAGERALFSRVETAPEVWEDRPCPIPGEPPDSGTIAIPSDMVKKVKDLPVESKTSIEIDFLPLAHLATKEPRPKYVYKLAAADGETGAEILSNYTTVSNQIELKRAWHNLAQRVMALFASRGRVPSELKVRSQRVMKMLRPIGMELPVKLSLHDSLENVARLFSR